MSAPEWLPVADAARRLRPRSPAKMRAVLERMAASDDPDQSVCHMDALGELFIHDHELPRLHLAAHDASQDDRLKEM